MAEPGPGSSADPEEVRAKALDVFRTIGASAVQSNLERIARLEEAVTAADEGRLDQPGRDRAGQLAHTIAGSAGTFGFSAATGPAHQLEDLFRMDRRGVDELGSAELGTARQLLAELRAVLAAAPEEDDF
ncbi:MAG: hypothetical protein QOF52_2264 [Propionibacteriaceae bacterium]|jgi:HPt (histidine-containing phosphotransfer) domain-containing protein|nr:Hpt protein [Propionibacteriaceae bacterium]MDX6322406.1 hypothetical protein [Propionibacteriaceae bacterium]